MNVNRVSRAVARGVAIIGGRIGMYFGRAGDVPSAASKTFVMASVCDRLGDWERGQSRDKSSGREAEGRGLYLSISWRSRLRLRLLRCARIGCRG